MTNASTNTKLIALSFAAVYIIWGSTYIAIKFVIEELPPFFSGGMRFGAAGLILLAMAMVRNKANLAWPTARQWIDCGILGFTLLVMGSSGVVLAEKSVPTGVVSLLVTAVPIYILLLEWLTTRVRPAATSFIGLLIGMAGMVVLLDPKVVSDTHGMDPIGVIYVLVGALGSAVGAVYSRKALLPRSQRLSAGMQMLMAGAMLMILSFVFREKIAVDDLRGMGDAAMWSLVYLTIFGSILAFSAYSYLLKHVPASRVATYAYVNPVVAVFLGWLMAHEPVTMRTLSGAVVLIFAVWLINKGKGEKKVAA